MPALLTVKARIKRKAGGRAYSGYLKAKCYDHHGPGLFYTLTRFTATGSEKSPISSSAIM